MAYDDSFKPPTWWFEELDQALLDLGWDHADLAREAREIDGRGKKWGSDRISKLRSERKATIQMVSAISQAAGIPTPVAEMRTKVEADAFKRWHDSYRRGQPATEDVSPKRATVAQTLAAAVKDKTDQSDAVTSADEGIPRGSRSRRTPRSR